MDFKKYLKEYEIYVDDEGNVYDDEGNVGHAGKEAGKRYGGETFGLKDNPFKGIDWEKARKTSGITDLVSLKDYAKKLGVKEDDVDRYWKEMKGNIAGIVKRIQFKARKK